MKIETFDFSNTVPLLDSVLWQYNEAKNLLSLLDSKQTWYNQNQTAFWFDWYQSVFDLANADSFGVCVWSIILDVPLYILNNPEPTNAPILGFNEYDPAYPDVINSYTNFSFGNFDGNNTFVYLTLEQQRFLLLLKYFQLSNLGDVDDINKFLNYLCAVTSINYSGTIYITDNLDMTITYTFTAEGFPTSLFYLIQYGQLDLLPRPAGVSVSYVFL